MAAMTSISAVIITKNEERNIEACLKSIEELVDEIVVVDSHSTDRTEEICKAFNVRFHKADWKGYAATKNYANSLASSEYILSLDADERLSKELHTDILQNKKEGLSGVYKMDRLSNYCGTWIRHCGWYPDRKIRLFPAAHARWEGEYVHEKLVFGDKLNITLLEGLLYHYSYYSIEDHLARIESYARLGAEKLAASGQTGGWPLGILKSAGRFISCYIFRLGFLDGFHGWIICKNTAYAIFLKYKYLNEIQRKKSR